MKGESLHIALAADSNYVIPITVVLQSIFDNHQRERICIYLLHLQGTLKEEDLRFFRTFTERHGASFEGLEITPEQVEGFPETRHGKSALLRLCLPGRLPSLHKILYLDGDIAVNDNLSALYTTDISAHRIAAGKDSAGVYDSSYPARLGIGADHFYFNTGVVLLNLDELRSLDLMKLMTDFTRTYYDRISSPDQDFLNYICQGKTLYIPPRYNMNYAVERDVLARIWSREEIEEARNHPAIVHYIGPVKPWSAVCVHPRRQLWWHYLRRTPFADFRPKDDTPTNRLRRCFLLCAKTTESLFTLSAKQKIGKLIPATIKKRIKKLLQKRTS